MNEEARAVVIHGAQDVRVESRPIVHPSENEVQVGVELGGICGSDISYFKHGAVGVFRVTAPMILGHEVIGRVREVGRGVATVAAGDRVVVDPSSPCLTCDRCREGRWNICLNPSFLGSASTQPHTDGGFSSVIVAKAQNLVPIPAELDEQLAVFAEPLAVTVHALGRANGVSGARVLVVGAGPIGAMLVAMAKLLGAAEVAAADLDAGRLATAAALGADRTLLVGTEDLGSGYDVVFDASGAEPAIADGFARVRRGGRFVLVGLPHSGPVALPVNLAVTGEVDIVGSFRFNHDEFRQAVRYLGDGLDLRPLISDRYNIDDAAAAFVDASSGASMKVQLAFDDAATR